MRTRCSTGARCSRPAALVTFGDNRLGETNLAGIIGFGPALVFAIVTMIAMVMLIRQGFANSSSS